MFLNFDRARRFVTDGENITGSKAEPETINLILRHARAGVFYSLERLRHGLVEASEQGGINTRLDERELSNLLTYDAYLTTEQFIEENGHNPQSPETLLGHSRDETTKPTLYQLRKDMGLSSSEEVLERIDRADLTKDEPYRQTLIALRSRLVRVAEELGVDPKEEDIAIVYEICEQSGVDPIGNILDADYVIRELSARLNEGELTNKERLVANFLLLEALTRMRAVVSIVENVYGIVAKPSGSLKKILRKIEVVREPKVEGITMPPKDEIEKRKRSLYPVSPELRAFRRKNIYRALSSGFGTPDFIGATASLITDGVLKEPKREGS